MQTPRTVATRRPPIVVLLSRAFPPGCLQFAHEDVLGHLTKTVVIGVIQVSVIQAVLPHLRLRIERQVLVQEREDRRPITRQLCPFLMLVAMGARSPRKLGRDYGEGSSATARKVVNIASPADWSAPQARTIMRREVCS